MQASDEGPNQADDKDDLPNLPEIKNIRRPSKQRYQLFYVSFYNEDRIIVATSQSLILNVCSDVLPSLILYQARRSNFNCAIIFRHIIET